MAKVSNNGLMAHAMKVNGKIIEHMVKVNSLILMETSMKATGSMTKPMVMESTFMSTVHSMRVTGRTTFKTVRAWNPGRMAPSTKEATRRA